MLQVSHSQLTKTQIVNGEERLDLVTDISLSSHWASAYVSASKGKVVSPANQRTSEFNKKQTVYVLGDRTAILIIAGTKACSVSLALSRIVEDVFRDDEIHLIPAPTVPGNLSPSLQFGTFHSPTSSKLRDMKTP
jgi:hypothetical protein